MRQVDDRFRVYDQCRGSFPYTTHELGPVLQDLPPHAAQREADRLNVWWLDNSSATGRPRDVLAPENAVDDDPLDEDVTSDRLSEADSTFVPARDKQEAVARISAWVGAPATELGPGSTEKKAVLVDTAAFLGRSKALISLPKPELARSLVEGLGGSWDESCSSSGSTVTLVGLNRLLRALESRTRSRGVVPGRQHPVDEAHALLGCVIQSTPPFFDGRRAVTAMREAESTDWAKSEWIGFYFEFMALGPCMTTVNGAPVPTNTRTVFDLGGNFVWDFKVHSEDKRWAILNDQAATDYIVDTRGGIGFVVLSGQPQFEPDFKAWHDNEKARHVKVRQPRAQPPRYSRRLKSSFLPRRVDAIFLTAADWAPAIEEGVLRSWNQPRQPGGQTRKPKYQIDVSRAAARWGLASLTIGHIRSMARCVKVERGRGARWAHARDPDPADCRRGAHQGRNLRMWLSRHV